MNDYQITISESIAMFEVSRSVKPWDHLKNEVMAPMVEAARLVANGATVWLCIENHPDGLRITNMPGGPGNGMCYFSGQGNPHLGLCGEYTLVAAALTPQGVTDEH